MFHRVKEVETLSDFRLCVRFEEGKTKLYDLKPLFREIPAFKVLQMDPRLFSRVKVDAGGYGIVWTDELDLSCNELFANGTAAWMPLEDEK